MPHFTTLTYRHLHCHPREDPRKGIGVNVGVVECGLYRSLYVSEEFVIKPVQSEF